VVVDNTWLTPVLLKPLELGADVVVHSCTKYMCGHGDALGGAAISNNETFMNGLFHTKSTFGGGMSPFNAYNILRGLGTLSIRVKRHCENAQKVSEFLAGHPAVTEVRYPGFAGDPHHQTARSMLRDRGFGGMLGFVVDGGVDSQKAFINALELCKPWVSLGDLYTHAYDRWVEERKGVPEGLIRMAIGLEDVADVIADIDQALDRMKTRR
jgi:methionine-gamma-lyase